MIILLNDMWVTAQFICTFAETYSLIVIKLHQDHVASHWVSPNLNILPNVFLYIFLLPFRIFVVMGNLFALSKISFLRCFLSFFFFSSLIAPFFVFYFSFYLIPFLSSFHFTRFSFLASPHSFYLSSHILFFLEFSIFWLNSS